MWVESSQTKLSRVSSRQSRNMPPLDVLNSFWTTIEWSLTWAMMVWLTALCLWQEMEHPRVLIPELCRLFYQLGWVTGTGGGISLKRGFVCKYNVLQSTVNCDYPNLKADKTEFTCCPWLNFFSLLIFDISLKNMPKVWFCCGDFS